MTTTTNNTENKKVTKTQRGVSYTTIAKHIKAHVFGIEEYDVITDLSEYGSHIIVTPKIGNNILCIDDLVIIATAFRASFYVTINDVRNRIEFIIY